MQIENNFFESKTQYLNYLGNMPDKQGPFKGPRGLNHHHKGHGTLNGKEKN
jgi:hypothetical protein